MPRLILRKKTEVLKEFIISKATVTAGSSDDNDIVINDQPISLRHCEVFEVEGKYFVKDLKSAFGTYLNDKRVSQAELKYGDVINFSDSPFDVLFFPSVNEQEKVQALGSRYFLLAIHGKLFGKKYELYKGETKIGRDDEFNDIVISGKLDSSVSRRHATVYFENNQVKISDKRSRNRTFVNQKVVGESEIAPVALNDEILIGHNIFRLVKEGSEDYSAPKKAGIFLDRYKVPALKIAAGFAAFLCLIAVIYSAYRILIIKKAPSAIEIETRELDIKMDVQGMADFQSEIYDTVPGLALGRRSGGKGKALIICALNGSIYSVNTESGLSSWPSKFYINEGISGSPVTRDVNDDNIDDVIVCGSDSRLYLLDGQKGGLIFKSQILGGRLNTTPAAFDLDSDGFMDVVCVSEDGIVLFVYNPSGSAVEKTLNLNSRVNSSPVVYTERATKRSKVVVAAADGKIYVMDGVDRNYGTLDTADGINKRKGTSLTTNEVGSVPVVFDINNDGAAELIVASKQNYVTCFSLEKFELIWSYYIAELAEKEFTERYSSPAAGDLDNDGTLDIILPWINGRVYALNGANGTLLWKQQTEESNRFIGSCALADINKDASVDIIAGGENGFIYVLDGQASLGVEVNRVLFKEKISPTPISSTPVVADTRNSGYYDIVFKNDLNKIWSSATNTRVLPGDMPWPMFRKDSLNSGTMLLNTYLGFFTLVVFAAIAVILAIMLTVFMLNKKKNIMKPQVVSLKEEVTH